MCCLGVNNVEIEEMKYTPSSPPAAGLLAVRFLTPIIAIALVALVAAAAALVARAA